MKWRWWWRNLKLVKEEISGTLSETEQLSFDGLPLIAYNTIATNNTTLAAWNSPTVLHCHYSFNRDCEYGYNVITMRQDSSNSNVYVTKWKSLHRCRNTQRGHCASVTRFHQHVAAVNINCGQTYCHTINSIRQSPFALLRFAFESVDT